MTHEDGGYESQHLHIVSEDRDDEWPGSALTKGTVYLDHSCDEWIIGGRKNVEAMIRDLQALLDKAR